MTEVNDHERDPANEHHCDKTCLSPGLLLTNHNIRNEAKAIYYGGHKFFIYNREFIEFFTKFGRWSSPLFGRRVRIVPVDVSNTFCIHNRNLTELLTDGNGLYRFDNTVPFSLKFGTLKPVGLVEWVKAAGVDGVRCLQDATFQSRYAALSLHKETARECELKFWAFCFKEYHSGDSTLYSWVNGNWTAFALGIETLLSSFDVAIILKSKSIRMPKGDIRKETDDL